MRLYNIIITIRIAHDNHYTHLYIKTKHQTTLMTSVLHCNNNDNIIIYNIHKTMRLYSVFVINVHARNQRANWYEELLFMFNNCSVAGVYFTVLWRYYYFVSTGQRQIMRISFRRVKNLVSLDGFRRGRVRTSLADNDDQKARFFFSSAHHYRPESVFPGFESAAII